MKQKVKEKNHEKVFNKMVCHDDCAKIITIKIKMFYLLIILLFGLPSTYAQNRSVKIPKLQHQDIEVITEAYHLWKTKGDSVWKGWTQINMPFIYLKENYEYRINFPKNLNKGKFTGKILNMNVYTRFTNNKNALAASMDINNIQAVVLSSPKITGLTKEEWIITAIHEMFHVFQHSETYQEKIDSLKIGYGKDASWMLNYPFPYQDTLLRNLSHVEGYLMFKIYKSDNINENMYVSFLLKDIISSYKRYIIEQYGNENNYKYSVFQQSVEGVAKYTELKMAEISRTEYTPLNPNIHFTDIYTRQINVVKHCGKGTDGRLTFYYLGLGMCLTLDKLYPDWKNDYFEVAWLDELLDKALKQIIEKQNSLN